MTLQIYIFERKPDGSEEDCGLREFASVPGPGDKISVTRSAATDRMRVLAIRHHAPVSSNNEFAMTTARTAKTILAERVKPRSE